MGPGFSPLDERLGLRPQTPFTPGLIESAARLGASLPFAQAAAILTHFTGVRMDPDTIRRWTEAAGQAAAALTDGAVATLYATYPDSPPGPAIQQLSVDGALVPLVGGVWAEVKTLAIGRVTTEPDGTPTTTELSYCSRLADATAFGITATLETHRRGTRVAGTVVAVTDGADWIQAFIDGQRREAVRILDFPYAVEHLATVAKAVFGAGTAATSDWLGTHAHALRHGQEAQVLAAVAALATSAARPPETAEVIRQTVAYFAKRQPAMRYAAFVAAGYPIGSGCVESANKLVVEARLKGAGMHWSRDHVNALLELRTMNANDRWTERWPAIWDGLRHRPRVAPVAPTPRSVPAAPPIAPARAAPSPTPRPKTVVNGTPTADHPWRRTSPFRAKR